MRQRSENSGTFLNEATRSLILFVAPQAAAPRGFRPDAGQADPCGGGSGKLVSPSRRRQCIDHVRGRLEPTRCPEFGFALDPDPP